MLILSRKAGESLILDGGIEIKITEIYGDKVRIGIDAPPQVKVYRKELYATIQENQSAAMAAPAARRRPHIMVFSPLFILNQIFRTESGSCRSCRRAAGDPSAGAATAPHRRVARSPPWPPDESLRK